MIFEIPEWWPISLKEKLSSQIEILNLKKVPFYIYEEELELGVRAKAYIEEGRAYILLSTLTPKTDSWGYVSAIFHELKHIEQFYLETLEEIAGKIFWKNEIQEIVEVNDEDYHLQPWEKDADEYSLNVMSTFYTLDFIKEYMKTLGIEL